MLDAIIKMQEIKIIPVDVELLQSELAELKKLTGMLFDDLMCIYNSARPLGDPEVTKEEFRAGIMLRLATREAGGN